MMTTQDKTDQIARSVQQFAESVGLYTELTTGNQSDYLHVFVRPQDYGILYLMDMAQIVECGIRENTLSLRSPEAIQPPRQLQGGEYICSVSMSDEYYSKATLTGTDPQEIRDCITAWLKRLDGARSELARLNIEASAKKLVNTLEKEDGDEGR